MALAAGFLLAAEARVSAAAEPAGDNTAYPVSMRVEANEAGRSFRPVWRFFGADEPNYAYLPHGRRLLGELGDLRPGEVFFRAHNLLTSGDGTPALKWGSTGAYSEDAEGRPVYDWRILDRIFDAYHRSRVRPYVQIGFMPRALSVKPEPYQHRWTPTARYEEIYTGWAWPPRDYGRWQELAYQWARHCLERYGRAEVERWYWEVWNEPNIGYWRGTPAEFLQLHDHAITGIRRAIPGARVGGPDVAGHGGNFMRGFLEHCLRGTNHATGRVGTPLDFVAFHAKGRPEFVDGHVRMGVAEQLRTIDTGFALVSEYPELRGTPIVIGESDPDGCAACQGPQLGYRNTTMYSSYTAASLARIDELAAQRQVNLEGVLTWAFTFEDQPLFAGFRQLATGGIDLPVLNVFRMLSRLEGRRVPVRSDAAVAVEAMMKEGVRGKPDVSALAVATDRRVGILFWHYHDDDVPGPVAEVVVEVAGLAGNSARWRQQHYRIDEEASNAFTAWRRMGSPAAPTLGQLRRLQRAGRLTQAEPIPMIRRLDGVLELRFRLPRQAVALVELEH